MQAFCRGLEVFVWNFRKDDIIIGCGLWIVFLENKTSIACLDGYWITKKGEVSSANIFTVD